MLSRNVEDDPPLVGVKTLKVFGLLMLVALVVTPPLGWVERLEYFPLIDVRLL